MADLIWKGIRVSNWRIVGMELAGLTKTGSASWWPGFFGDKIADIGGLLEYLERVSISLGTLVYGRYICHTEE